MRAAWPTLVLSSMCPGFHNPLLSRTLVMGPIRVIVVERAGRVRVAHWRHNAPDAFSRHFRPGEEHGSEQGLLSIAFPPNFAATRYFYVNYTDQNGIGNTVVSRFYCLPTAMWLIGQRSKCSFTFSSRRRITTAVSCSWTGRILVHRHGRRGRRRRPTWGHRQCAKLRSPFGQTASH